MDCFVFILGLVLEDLMVIVLKLDSSVKRGLDDYIPGYLVRSSSMIYEPKGFL